MSVLDTTLIDGLDLNEAEGMMEKAAEHLRQAATFLRLVESRPKPYRVSKILNMMAKTTQADYIILKVLLGKMEEKNPSYEALTHAVKLYNVQLEEQAEKKRK